jgi:nicotinate-nucleotide adenylyltransferase
VKVGVMGGTFDPIHLGHLRAAENAREGLGLDEVRFVPAQVPPHRPAPVSSARDRFAMVALATALHPRFVPDDLELKREGPSYTVDTIARLREERPADEVVLVVGSDTLPELSSWKDHERLMRLCTVAVVTRPDDGADDDAAAYSPHGAGDPAPAVRRVPGPGLAVSATEIRRRVKEGRSIRYLVPETVADYIAKRGLYR